MKWFKHMADASNDELVADLEDEMGHTGYALWFKTLEIVAAQMKPNDPPALTLPISKWCANLRVNKKKLNSFLVLTEFKRKIKFVYLDNKLSIEIPKLLEIRDNATNNLQATSKRLASIDVDTDKEVEGDNKDLSKTDVLPDSDVKKILKRIEFLWVYTPDFERVWAAYPRKLGKKDAQKHFRASVKTREDFDLIGKALENYHADIRTRGTEPDYIQHGSTWFNNWRDWVEYKASATVTSAPKQQYKTVKAPDSFKGAL